MNEMLRLMITILSVSLFSAYATAQQGTGDSTGIAQQAVKPPVVTVSGKLLEIQTGPCEAATGRSPTGTHLIVQSEDGAKLDIHLGPDTAVDHVVEQLVIGQTVTLEAFRTDRLPDDAYIAKSLLLDEKTIHLRDDNLRPSWAYARHKGQGQGQGMGQGRGRWGSCW